MVTGEQSPPADVTVRAKTYSGRLSKEVQDLLEVIEPVHTYPYPVFCGLVEMPETELAAVVTYHLPSTLALGRMDPLQVPYHSPLELRWTDPHLLVECATHTGEFLGQFELTRLGPGQSALARVLSPSDEDLWVTDLLEVPDGAAAAAAVVDARAVCALGYGQDTVQLPLVEFANDLTRLGVASWTVNELTLLNTLARNWSGEAYELVDVVHATLR